MLSPVNYMRSRLIAVSIVAGVFRRIHYTTATTRQVILEITLKLDIGIFGFKSSRLSDGFCNLGQMGACFWLFDNVSSLNDNILSIGEVVCKTALRATLVLSQYRVACLWRVHDDLGDIFPRKEKKLSNR